MAVATPITDQTAGDPEPCLLAFNLQLSDTSREAVASMIPPAFPLEPAARTAIVSTASRYLHKTVKKAMKKKGLGTSASCSVKAVYNVSNQVSYPELEGRCKALRRMWMAELDRQLEAVIEYLRRRDQVGIGGQRSGSKAGACPVCLCEMVETGFQQLQELTVALCCSHVFHLRCAAQEQFLPPVQVQPAHVPAIRLIIIKLLLL